MKNIVVEGDGFYFKDDIKIDDQEVGKPLVLPQPLPIVSEDDLKVMYRGEIWVPTQKPPDNNYMKVWNTILELQLLNTTKAKENDYFAANQAALDQQRKDFLERCIVGTTERAPEVVNTQLSQELTERINKEYANLDTNADCAFQNLQGTDEIMFLDNKVYTLLTIPEYLKMFEQSFMPEFYNEAIEYCRTATPEEIHKYLSENHDKIADKALPVIRNKIWHSDQSFKLHLDGQYWIPEFKEPIDDMKKAYEIQLERRVKLESVGEFQ